MSDFYQVVGMNNRNTLVQSRRLAPYHEDLTKIQSFEPSSVNPGQYTKIKLDLKHAMDREYILNDIRLRFTVDFSARANVGKVFAVRGTDLIRELVVKVNEDVVFKVDKKLELSMLWEMNNHKTVGTPDGVHDAFLMNHGVIPKGRSPPSMYLKASENKWYFYDMTNYLILNPAILESSTTAQNLVADAAKITTNWLTQPTLERYDGRPRLIWDDAAASPYSFTFDISLNQLCGAIFNRLHLRRIEFLQFELMFEPWVNAVENQNHLLFKNDPTLAGTVVHPYSVARFKDVEIRQFRSVVLDGVNGFTLPDNRMLSWLMHRYSRREFTFNFTTDTQLDIQLHDWEIRTNIVRVWWMIAPLAGSSTSNVFRPMGEPCEPYDALSGVEVLWKNDKVLDLATTFDVYRHYILSDNKRYGYDDPFARFARLEPPLTGGEMIDGKVKNYRWNYDHGPKYAWNDQVGNLWYEFPIYHVDLNMNVQAGAAGSEVIGGIVNDTSDYIIRLKKLSDQPFLHTGSRTIWVWIEYLTLVNLAANSNQFQRGSQVITKQLNLQ